MNPDSKNTMEQRQELKQLRDKVEALLSTPSEHPASLPATGLLHELQVHQIELEMQNEQLRQAHTALEAARDQYMDLYEFAPVGYITVNREGLISQINLTGATLLGMERGKLLNQRFAKFVVAQETDRWYRLFMSMTEHHPDIKLAFELQMVHADGSTFYAHLDCLRRERVGTPCMFRLALVDISKIKQAEAELRIAATAFESQEGIMVTDSKVVILRVNQAFTNITGYSAEEVIGKKPDILQSGRQPAEFYAAMWHSVNNTDGWAGEIWNKRKNGEIYPQHLAITAVKDADGVVINYVGTLTDSSMKMELAAEKIHRETDKVEVYVATMQAANHIINTLINQLQLVRMAAMRSQDFDPQVLKYFDQMTAEATELIGKLSSIEQVSKQVIYRAVHPE